MRSIMPNQRSMPKRVFRMEVAFSGTFMRSEEPELRRQEFAL
jgi:hypothetical protein